MTATSVPAPNVTALNAICPYFTMFPLEFPLRVLSRYAASREWVLDPFCGRGTTNFAARLRGLPSAAVDCNPVAIAATRAKLVDVTPEDVVEEARRVLTAVPNAEIPEGEFWLWAYHPETLRTVCRLRAGLLHDASTSARAALQGILLGALHGPMKTNGTSYLSNQSPRTYAPKPRYAVRFWRERGMRPPCVDVVQIIEERARRYYGSRLPTCPAEVEPGDSRDPLLLRRLLGERRVSWIITSPPYYGLDTYLADQWLRSWLLGAPPVVDYDRGNQVLHRSPARFVADLRIVWNNVAAVATRGARLVIRFGGINERQHVDPMSLIKESLKQTPWRTQTAVPAGSASLGKRQAVAFFPNHRRPIQEYDLWAVKVSPV